MEKCGCEKVDELTTSEDLSFSNMNFLLMDVDGKGNYPTAIAEKEAIYPKSETRFALTKNRNDHLFHAFSDQSFTKRRVDPTIKN